jgi:D-tyrosyl-tRNA(Tyr) deacylase
MKVLLQRVHRAKVTIENKVAGEIGSGLLLLIGIAEDDLEKDLDYTAQKCVNLRVFNDEEGKMNRSLLDVQGEILAISQFTLMADTRKGRRPSFIGAANPEKGKLFYDRFVEKLKNYGVKVECGIFGASMDVELINAGPVTIMVESK